MTRVGVIGVGGMGFTHVKALKSLAEEMDLQVVAIADLQEKYQKRVDDFFNQRDHKNCERNYRAVQKLLNEGRNETNARNS